MTYATLMVHLQLGTSNTGVVRIAGDLAARFEAGVIGIAACQPLQVVYADGIYVSGGLIDQDREQIGKDLEAAEAEFKSVLQARGTSAEWRSAVTFGPVSDYLAREARSADLVITGVASDSWPEGSRHANTGDLVMQVGRPVLVVPATADTLRLDRMIVAWKDSRETRRAIFDALPLLRLADHVAVVEIAAAEDLAEARRHLEDVVGWLKRHGVAATALAVPSTGDDASRLGAIAQEQRADIVVAGAYGHSRLREWALGGVTRNLLLRGNRCALVSH